MSNEVKECSICYDAIGDKNSCVTPCGHVFCFNCMMKSLAMKNECPCCRAMLTQEKEEPVQCECCCTNNGEFEGGTFMACPCGILYCSKRCQKANWRHHKENHHALMRERET